MTEERKIAEAAWQEIVEPKREKDNHQPKPNKAAVSHRGTTPAGQVILRYRPAAT